MLSDLPKLYLFWYHKDPGALQQQKICSVSSRTNSAKPLLQKVYFLLSSLRMHAHMGLLGHLYTELQAYPSPLLTAYTSSVPTAFPKLFHSSLSSFLRKKRKFNWSCFRAKLMHRTAYKT